MNAHLKTHPSTCKTTEGFIVEAIELRGNDDVKLSGIIRSDKMYSDYYVSWNLDGTKPSIERFGDLILDVNNIDNNKSLNSTIQLFGKILDKNTSESYSILPNVFYEVKQVTLNNYAIIEGTVYMIPLNKLELRILDNNPINPLELETILKLKLKKGI